MSLCEKLTSVNFNKFVPILGLMSCVFVLLSHCISFVWKSNSNNNNNIIPITVIIIIINNNNINLKIVIRGIKEGCFSEIVPTKSGVNSTPTQPQVCFSLFREFDKVDVALQIPSDQEENKKHKQKTSKKNNTIRYFAQSHPGPN